MTVEFGIRNSEFGIFHHRARESRLRGAAQTESPCLAARQAQLQRSNKFEIRNSKSEIDVPGRTR